MMRAGNVVTSDDRLVGAEIIGYNQKQNGSILQAGARAFLIHSDLTMALSTPQGRIAAQTVMLMGASQKLMNYAALRPYAIMEVIRRHFPAGEHPVILDPTTGYGAEYIWLAEEFPHARFIEMDRPDVILNKRQRLKDFTLPSNLTLEGADLINESLESVLQDRQIDMIVILGTYVTAAEFGSLLLYLRTILPPGGTVVAPFPFKTGMVEMARTNAIFRRFAAAPAGTVHNKAEVDDIFRRAGYQDIAVYSFGELARDLGKPEPFDIEMIGVGRTNL